MTKLRWVGLDVHAETIAVAVAETGGEVRALGTIPNRPESVRKLVRKLGPAAQLRACYEAGPTGYVLYWQLTALGVRCEVVAPTLVPVKAGDRVKTDRRDAERLARSYRAGDLTPVWVPDAAHEALRDLVRAREAAKTGSAAGAAPAGEVPAAPRAAPADGDESLDAAVSHVGPAGGILRVRRPGGDPARLSQRSGTRGRAGGAAGAGDPRDGGGGAAGDAHGHRRAAGAARGGLISAVTIVAEVGPLSRFARPAQLMGYAGLGPREASSGGRTWRGGITKTGNAHLRRVVVEAGWAYRHRPAVTGALRTRQGPVSEAVKAIGLEGAAAVTHPLLPVARAGKSPATGGDGAGARALGLHLGHWRDGRT